MELNKNDEYVDQLIINRLNREQYNQLCSDRKIKPYEIYFVDDDDFDVFGKKITNVLAPSNGSDAVNLTYLKSNYINQTDISTYVDYTKIFSQNMMSCISSDGVIYERQMGDSDWTFDIVKGNYSQNQITGFYYGTKGQTGSGFGWAFKIGSDYEIKTGNRDLNTLKILNITSNDGNVIINAFRNIWKKYDMMIKASVIYRNLSSITLTSSLEDVTLAINKLNSAISSYIS